MAGSGLMRGLRPSTAWRSVRAEGIPIEMRGDATAGQMIILGAGGGGRTAASIIEAQYTQCKEYPGLAFLDDRNTLMLVNGYPVVGPVSRALDETDWPEGTGFIVAFGSTCLAAREEVFGRLQ